MSIFYFSGPSHLILITPTAREASLLWRFINLVCARRHFNHKSRVLGLENSRRGNWGRGMKTTRRSEPGRRCHGVAGGGKGTIGRPPLRPLPAASAGDGPGLRHPSEGCATATFSRLGEGGWGRGKTGRDPGRGPGAAWAAAPAFRARAPPEVAPWGGCIFFFWSRRGVAGGRGPVCVPLRAGALPPPRRRPEPHKRTGCC